MHIPFDNTYAALPEGFYSRVAPTSVTAPHLLAYNSDLARQLGIGPATPEDIAGVLSGNVLAPGSAPLAQLYAGHQFGSFNPQLGDGRAILLGEVIDTNGIHRDLQLKGSGPTPYSRMGDGRAWLGPVLREYLVSEAMHAVGIATTRALAAVATGETVYRERALPGAVLTRVARSHLRVGTFQIFAHRGDTTRLRILTQYAIDRHYPTATGPMDLLRHVCAAQAELVAAWLSVGFIHGVMNTDNCAISGETIDYGPCAFMDAYHPGRVYSSIDSQGRYAYGNQPDIAVWNMAQLATSLIPLLKNTDAAVDEATQIIHAMPDQIASAWLGRFAAKIGISAPQPGDRALIEGLLTLMQTDGADFTNSFRALANGSARDHFTDRAAFDAWAARWRARIATETDPTVTMQHANPAVIPRNHRVEQAIAAALVGDLAPFERLSSALATPFTATDPELHRPPQQDEIVPATFCGT